MRRSGFPHARSCHHRVLCPSVTTCCFAVNSLTHSMLRSKILHDLSARTFYAASAGGGAPLYCSRICGQARVRCALDKLRFRSSARRCLRLQVSPMNSRRPLCCSTVARRAATAPIRRMDRSNWGTVAPPWWPNSSAWIHTPLPRTPATARAEGDARSHPPRRRRTNPWKKKRRHLHPDRVPTRIRHRGDPSPA